MADHNELVKPCLPSSQTLCKCCIAGLELAFTSEPRLSYSVIQSSCIPDESKHADIKHYINYNSGKVFKFEKQVPVFNKPMETFTNWHSISSPVVHKVPYEILGEIFSYATHSREGIDIASNLGLWAMRNVCERWRYVVDGTPNLWSKFTYERNWYNIDEQTLITRTEMCLRFSRSALLSISVMPDPVLPTKVCLENAIMRSRYRLPHLLRRKREIVAERIHTDYIFPQKIFEDLVRHADRWHSISIDLEVIHNSRLLTLTKQIAFKNLKGLHLYDPYDPHFCTSAEFHGTACSKCAFNFFKQANGLEEVTLENIIVRDDTDLMFQWPKVKTLNMWSTRKFSQNYPRALLNCMPNLENFTCTGGIEMPLYSKREELILIPSLRNLHIDGENFLDAQVSMPHLTQFEVSKKYFHSHRRFQEMVKRSGCSLKSVNVILCHNMDAGRFLQYLPEVEDLTLSMRYAEYAGSNLQLLTWKHSNILLSCLKQLVLNIEVPLYMDPGNIIHTVADIVMSRSQNTASTSGMSSTLSSVKCTLKLLKKIPHIDVSELEHVGKALGVNVEVKFKRIWISSLTYCRDDDYYMRSDLSDY